MRLARPVTMPLTLIALTLLGGCTTVGQVPSIRLGSAMLKSANGLPAGTAQLLAVGDQVTLSVAIAGLPQGPHGLHLHAVGLCATPDFASAGPHLNPGGHQHGAENPAGSHLGDLPNVTAGSAGAGSGTAQLKGTRAQIEQALFDGDGTAIMVHADADDYRTDPSGNSGKRIACGVLQRP